MVFDVAGTLDRVGVGGAALEFMKQRAMRLAITWVKTFKRPRCGMPMTISLTPRLRRA